MTNENGTKAKTKPRVEPTKRSVAEALVKESDPNEVVAYFCTTCGRIYVGKSGKDDAERCSGVKCTKWSCDDCGEASSPFQRYCSKCASERQAAREEKELADVEDVISWRDYPDDQGVVWSGVYYQSIEDLNETCFLESIEFPSRVWAAAPTVFRLDAADILSAAFEAWADGSDVSPDYAEADGFKGAVSAFNEAVSTFNKANDGMVIFWEVSAVVDLVGYPSTSTEEE